MALAGGSDVAPGPENSPPRYLPRVVCASQALRLPLCVATSIVLETALLSPDAEQRRLVLRNQLYADPVFFLWVACRAWWGARHEVMTPEAAAEWLAPRVLDELASLAQADGPRDESVSNVSELRALANRGLHLCQASAWLAFAAESQLAQDPLELLPPRLAASISMADGVNDEADAVSAERAANWLREDACSRARLPWLVDRLMRLQQLETRFDEVLEREKIESLRQLAYGAGHEINNPLANISARAQTLLKEESDPERRRRLAAINSQAFRAHEMIADLMLFSRPPQLVFAEVDLVDLVDTVLAELDREAKLRAVALRRAGANVVVLAQADRLQLAVALRAMCINSLEAIGNGGTIELEVCSEMGWLQIVVKDTGPGIRPEVRRHLFDPFFSGREAGRGLGFGLSKCWRIVTDHGGQIRVESPTGGGATFIIRLPATNEDLSH